MGKIGRFEKYIMILWGIFSLVWYFVSKNEKASSIPGRRLAVWLTVTKAAVILNPEGVKNLRIYDLFPSRFRGGKKVLFRST